MSDRFGTVTTLRTMETGPKDSLPADGRILPLSRYHFENMHPQHDSRVITFLTGNSEKIQIAKYALSGTELVIEQHQLDIPEIQADDIVKVAAESARYGAALLNRPVVKTDKGLFIEALGGFPGPYSHYVEDRLSEVDMLRLMSGLKNRSACFREALAYCVPGLEPVVFESVTHGSIADIARGCFGRGFDKIFVRTGDAYSLAHFPDEERAARYNTEHWSRLALYLSVGREVR